MVRLLAASQRWLTLEPAVSDTASDWHALSIEQACTRLDAGRKGIASAEAKRRLAQYGPNTLPEATRRGLAGIILDQLRSPLIYLLLLAAAVSIVLGEYKDFDLAIPTASELPDPIARFR